MSIYKLEISDLVDKVTIETAKKEHYQILQKAFFKALEEIEKERKKNEKKLS